LLKTVKKVTNLHRFEKIRLQSIFSVATLVFDDFLQATWHAVYQSAAIIWSDVANPGVCNRRPVGHNPARQAI